MISKPLSYYLTLKYLKSNIYYVPYHWYTILMETRNYIDLYRVFLDTNAIHRYVWDFDMTKLKVYEQKSTVYQGFFLIFNLLEYEYFHGIFFFNEA